LAAKIIYKIGKKDFYSFFSRNKGCLYIFLEEINRGNGRFHYFKQTPWHLVIFPAAPAFHSGLLLLKKSGH